MRSVRGGARTAIVTTREALLEREEALDAVARVLSRTRSGEGGAVFIVGEAGLGKTSVLVSAQGLVGHDFGIGVGRGDPMEASLPFGVLAQALGTLGGASVLESDVPASAPEIRATRFLRVQRWLSERDRPTLLAFDDLQWADPDSLALLSFVTRRVKSMPVAIIGTLRPWPPEAARIANDRRYAGDAELCRLPPLTDAAAGALIEREISVPVPPSLLQRAITLCQGNPLMLEELAHAIGRGEEFPDAVAIAGSGGLPELLLARFGQLPEGAARVARAASVLGVTFDASVAVELADITGPAGDDALTALWSSGVVRAVDGDHIEFVHPLLCQALYDDIPPPLRVQLHAQAFAVLSGRGLVARAAKHVGTGGLARDPKARRVVEHAANQALRAGAPATAVAQLNSIVDEVGDESEASLLSTLGEALMASGAFEPAAVICGRIVSHVDASDVQKASALRILGRLNYLLARHDTALENFAAVTSLVGDSNPEIACQALIDLVLSGTFMAGPAETLPAAERAMSLSIRGDATLQRRAAAAWGFAALQSGDPSGFAALEALVTNSAGIDSATEDPYWSWSPSMAYGIAATLIERFDDAEGVIQRRQEAADRLDD